MIRKLLTYLSLTLLLIAGGCSDDEPLDGGYRGDASLNLLIPSTVLSRSTGETRGLYPSRADGDTSYGHADGKADVSTDEGKIHDNFYVVAFFTKEGSNDLDCFYEELDESTGKNVDGVYRSYSLNVAPGIYDLYIVANVPEMASEITTYSNSSKTATAISNFQTKVMQLCHSYASGTGTTPTAVLPDLDAGLPMACEKHGVTVSSSGTTNVYANLEFLCAKVRLTVIHDEEFGQTGLYMSSLGVENVYSPVNCFMHTTKAFTTKDAQLDNVGSTIGHYVLTPDIANMELPALAAIPASEAADVLGSLTTNESVSTSTSGIDQATCYLPATLEYNASNPITNLIPLFANASGNIALTTPVKFPVGDTKYTATRNRSQSCNMIERGHYYDIVAKFIGGGQVQFSWSVKSWTPATLSIDLSGNTDLWLEKTVIGDSDHKVNGETPYTFKYTTSAPILGFQSCEYDGEPVFSITENKNEGLIEVTLDASVTDTKAKNSNFPKGANLGFWVEAGNVRKWVTVQNIDASTFFRISPDSRHLYISQIINETDYPLVYEFATNMDEFTLNLSEYTNTNDAQEKENLSVAIYTGTYDGTFDNMSQFTDQVKLVPGMDLKGIRKLSANSSKPFPKSGYVVVWVKQPANQNAFGKVIEGKIYGKGTSNKDTDSEENHEDDGTFDINPSPTKYTIHFKDNTKNWCKDNKIPHIYVYQPLTYTYNGKEYECYDVQNDKGKINWLEFSFTGKMVFKGWSSEGGDVADLTGGPETWTHEVTNEQITGYKIWSEDGKADNAGSFKDAKYYKSIDMISEHRKNTSCDACKGSSYHQLWPGVAMIAEGDGWYKIELPMLAEPGKAMVMFNDGHNNDGNRYPAEAVPGVPLPNFGSCEAWFLYDDETKYDIGFSDYKRTSYAQSGGNQGGGNEETTTYSIYWPKGLEFGGYALKEVHYWSPSEYITDPSSACDKAASEDGEWYRFDVKVRKDKDFSFKVILRDGNDWHAQTIGGDGYTFTQEDFDAAHKVWLTNFVDNSDHKGITFSKSKVPTLSYFIPGDYKITFNGSFNVWLWAGSEPISKDNLKEQYHGEWVTNTKQFSITNTHSASDNLSIEFHYEANSAHHISTKNISPTKFKWNSTSNRWEAGLGDIDGFN